MESVNKNAKNIDSEYVRFGYTTMFGKMIGYWGDNTKDDLTKALENRIKKCECKFIEEKDIEFKWVCDVLQKIIQQADKDKDSYLVFGFIHERRKFNEDHMFNFEDWLWALGELNKVSKNFPLVFQAEDMVAYVEGNNYDKTIIDHTKKQA